MQVMNDLDQQIKGIRKGRRERDFIGSLNSSSRMARRTTKAVRVSGKRVLGIPWKALGAGTHLPAQGTVVNVLTRLTIPFFLLHRDGQREAQRQPEIRGYVSPSNREVTEGRYLSLPSEQGFPEDSSCVSSIKIGALTDRFCVSPHETGASQPQGQGLCLCHQREP